MIHQCFTHSYRRQFPWNLILLAIFVSSTSQIFVTLLIKGLNFVFFIDEIKNSVFQDEQCFQIKPSDWCSLVLRTIHSYINNKMILSWQLKQSNMNLWMLASPDLSIKVLSYISLQTLSLSYMTGMLSRYTFMFTYVSSSQPFRVMTPQNNEVGIHDLSTVCLRLFRGYYNTTQRIHNR